jgi:methylated-DNA-protein-cysteine methyltransferase-like protein
MAGSPFYARIKAQVLLVLGDVPKGRVLTAAEIGGWLDVPARHVAYILAKLTPEEEARVPWYRVVGASGTIDGGRANAFGVSQRELLAEEGVPIAADGRIKDFAERQIAVDALSLSLPRQRKPTNAPVTPRRKAKRPD